MDKPAPGNELETLFVSLSEALNSAQKEISDVLDKCDADLDDDAMHVATEGPEDIVLRPYNKGRKWPEPTIRTLRNWRPLILEMITDEEHDRKYYQAVLSVLDTGMMDIAHVQTLWALDSAVAFIEVRYEALEELLDARTSGHGIAGVNDPNIRQNMEAVTAVIEVYKNVAASLRLLFTAHIEAIRNPILKENEACRLEDEWE